MDFFWLLFAHFLGDLPLQGEWVCKEKGKEPLFMFGHCIIWTGIVSLALIALGSMAFWKIPFLFIGHYFMDSLKCHAFKKTLFSHEEKMWVYGDQLFHLGQLLCIYFF